jgi:4a-hydroxytetrahydrobiopterin dehydratase
MELKDKKCVPCEGGVEPMQESEEEKYINDVPSWSIERNGEHKIRKEFKFDDFKQAMKFVNNIADIAQKEGHHPNFCVNYNVVNTVLFTHAIGGLSENDFIMAAKIDNAL